MRKNGKSSDVELEGLFQDRKDSVKEVELSDGGDHSLLQWMEEEV